MKSFLIPLIMGCALVVQAQSPTGASTGADGALELTTPGTVVFDPRSFNPALNASGDNIFQFTTIHVGQGVTVRLSSKNLSGPMFWIAQGPVQIDGTIDVSGEEGGPWPASAGTGGYPGGAPSSAGFGATGAKRNVFLVPLLGGNGGKGGTASGGGGWWRRAPHCQQFLYHANGKIIANGGKSSGGRGGDGGMIRLVAPLIDGKWGDFH